MIQCVSQIEKEFLIKTIADNAQPIRFHGISSAVTGRITDIGRSTLGVTLLDTFGNSGFSICEHLTGYFDFHGKTYAFESTIRDSSGGELSIDPPVKLLRSLQRKYVRVKRPRGVAVKLSLANEDISLDYPICPEYVSVEKEPEKNEFSGKKLADMIALFQAELSARNAEQTIIMFRSRKPDRFEEELVTATGKVLFIPSTSASLPKTDPYPEGRVITETLEETFEDPNYFVEGSKFDGILTEKRADGITSEIWCPIVFYQYVVGYIYAGSRSGDSFDITMVDYLWDFSRILAYRLKETGYFKGGESKAKNPGHSARILDMSPEGMLIALPMDEIRTPIKEGSFFSVEIATQKTTVRCTAKVMRRFEENDTRCYGTSFCGLSSQDIMTLYQFLYRRPFANDDPLAYEQKAMELA
ncbi:MAG TPA: PilZ domain-containing protein [Treponemataceae bacterium]|nr:PilZ domain-containing protein [Treponemataceae bacterium]HPS43670.1 PilZ domain-containing protein [Treponemataceae bacterium]